MRRIGYRHQRTLANSSEVRGVGFVAGARVRLRFRPAPPDTGIVFVRTDLLSRPTTLARVDRVTGTNRRTTLGSPDTGVTLVEHVLAALSGLRIDNCVIELDTAEPPGLDGSSFGFLEALNGAGTVLQPARRAVWAVSEPLVVSHGGATIALHPVDPVDGPVLRASYLLDYGPRADIPRQAYTTVVTPDTFARELAGCRTFVLEKEADALRAQGVGNHLTMSELLVFGPKGPIDNTLRYADEPARHKVLDLIGDLALCGFDLVGHVVAYRSGHALNVSLAHALVARARGVSGEVTAGLPRPQPVPAVSRRLAA
ncbi:UDP-3-O-acyl-N-acetylglucosamine deacetylase [Fimbriiglobus ruber]|uniref:UDP-3-O-acyl-N-acetylglucosamine deacetylase n=1 Tax=Fimbriiglobus ruber TaxID=1908690 RepID=A0A225DPR8_9BACT|nr:UDP-3-O-acyl-N-acetylglucosamine deacetylase [Fimbriiglobus ruber]OWK43430.1 UDP-3-O-[3-hydroxymyristoyl] N-acetylglucosamine deacetylase [Fimbriiglobus ruber]